MERQSEFDFSTRGHRLRCLERVQFPSGQHGNRRVSGNAIKTVLRAIDDCIGSDESWVISIDRLISQTQLSRSTIKTAIAVLGDWLVLSVSSRHELLNGNPVQLPSRFRIVWSNLPDFLPVADSVKEQPRTPQIVESERVSAPTEPGGFSVNRGSVQCEPGVGSPCTQGGFSVNRGSVHGEPVPAQSRPDPSQPRTNPAPERGRKFLTWKDATADDLRAAVKTRETRRIESLWTEALLRGWIKRTEHLRHQFYSTVCYAVSDPAVKDAKAWLVSIVKNGKWGVGLNGDLVNQAEDRARQLIRQQDGLADLPRSGPDPKPQTRSPAEAILALQAAGSH